MLLNAFNIPFEEIQESLNREGISERLGKYSETRKVPVLIVNKLVVWDSLAICEYISENYLNGQGWPETKKHRAIARAICSEMHSGFFALRNEIPMNCRATRKIELSDSAKSDIARIDSIWSAYAMKTPEGDLSLFGKFSIADCFYAPVAFRFKTYGTELSAPAKAYMLSLLNHPSVRRWLSMALSEKEILSEGERGI